MGACLFGLLRLLLLLLCFAVAVVVCVSYRVVVSVVGLCFVVVSLGFVFWGGCCFKVWVLLGGGLELVISMLSVSDWVSCAFGVLLCFGVVVL